MRAKIVVFPIRGKNWCFSHSIDPSVLAAQSSNTPSTFRDFFSKLFSSPNSSGKKSEESKLELTIDFATNKMNGAWSNMEKAPQGSVKNKIHGLGLKLLSRVKPSEIFFKSIPKEVDRVDIIYPPCLNPRLVRRRLRHIAFRGSVVHTKFFYGSAIMLPLTSVFMVLPLPNIPFFWILFRTYSHWRASQGSEKVLHLVSQSTCEDSDKSRSSSTCTPWAFQPSEELQKLLHFEDDGNDLSESSLSKICKKYYLNSTDVVKYRDSV